MRQVCIVGKGQLPIGEHWDKSIQHLAFEAIAAALADAQIERPDAMFLGNMSSGVLSGQENLAASVADFCGFRGIEAVKIESACASGGASLRMGYMAVAGGIHDLVVVAGVEKMTDSLGPDTTAALSMAADAVYETFQGVSFTALNALLMQRYMWAYDVPDDGLAGFSLNAHRNGAQNPVAMFQQEITADDYAKARVISSPLNVLDSSPICDGAAALVLAPLDQVKSLGGASRLDPVRILGSAVTSDTLALHDRQDPLHLTAVEEGSRQALDQAGLLLSDLDFCEVHDAFSILSALSLEAIGYAPRGTGWRYAMEGYIDRQGEFPISTQGGLKSRGHPVGATGIYQAIEAANQIQGLAGANQVPGAQIGMVQNIGGSGASVVTHLLSA